MERAATPLHGHIKTHLSDEYSYQFGHVSKSGSLLKLNKVYGERVIAIPTVLILNIIETE